MAFLVRTALVVLVFSVVGLDATFKDAVDSVSTGRLYALQENGAVRSLLRQDVQSIQNDKHHHIRLSLDDGSLPLDMHLKQGSVWDTDSVLAIKRGKRTFNVPIAADSDCYLNGQVHSHGGAVSINRCGRMTGHIHVPGHHYELKEIPHSVDGDIQRHAHFTVTRRKAEKRVIGKEEMDALRTNRELFEPVNVEEDNDMTNMTSREKREIKRITIELAIFADANYVDYLVDRRNLHNYDAIREWFVDKWNLVKGALSNVEEIGTDITIKLKKVKLWWDNPRNYPPNDVAMNPRLNWFCRNTRELRKYDTGVLYTKSTFGHQNGMAYVGGACMRNYNCLILKSPTPEAVFEIHELGHTLGFPHDPDFNPPCEGGFMGWDLNYVYLPCYKSKLASELSYRDKRCLFHETAAHNSNDNPMPDPTSTTEDLSFQDEY